VEHAPLRARTTSWFGVVALTLTLVVVTPSPGVAHPDACEEKQEVAAVGFAGRLLGLVNVFAAFLPLSSSEADHDAEDEECFSEELAAQLDDADATLRSGEVAADGLQLIANLPKSGPFDATSAYNSDIAFSGTYAIQGNYQGIQVTDISDPGDPQVVSQVDCPGSQNDVSVHGDLIITSTDSPRTNDTCDNDPQPPARRHEPSTWEGIRVFDWSDPTDPQLLTSVRTFCGSHTHTIVPDGDRLLVYVSSYDLQTNYWNCNEDDAPWTNISIVEVPLDDPASARVIGEPNPWEGTEFTPNPGTSRSPGWPEEGYPGTRRTTGCHDITAYPALALAAGACMGEGVLMDISDPTSPTVVSQVMDDNFAFWHSATFSHDGSAVLFTDELGGGGSATCNPTIPAEQGANGIYVVEDGQLEFASYWKLPRTQWNTENCVAHNGSLLPLADRTVMAQAWYQGGIVLLDWTDPYDPRELAWFDRGPLSEESLVLGGSWSAYFYNGHIYSNDIQQGLDVLRIDPRAIGARSQRELNSIRWDEFNAQHQEPLPAAPGR
jgi:hypothetical protein